MIAEMEDKQDIYIEDVKNLDDPNRGNYPFHNWGKKHGGRLSIGTP